MDERSRIAEREQTVIEQERTVRALELEKELGRAPISEERLDQMRDVAKEGRAQIEGLKEVYEIPLYEYDRQVNEIREEVVSLKDAFEYVAKNGVTTAKLHMLHDGLDAAQERLQEWDEKTSQAAESKERRVVIDMINDLRMVYPLHEMAVAASVDLSRARELHRDVRAAYAAAESQLGPEDQQRLKGRITQLAAQVRHIEHHHWLRLVRMSRAKKIAPAIADAVTTK